MLMARVTCGGGTQLYLHYSYAKQYFVLSVVLRTTILYNTRGTDHVMLNRFLPH